MAKKMFLRRKRAIQSAQIPSVKREEIASTSRNNPLSEQLHFMFLKKPQNLFQNLMRPAVVC